MAVMNGSFTLPDAETYTIINRRYLAEGKLSSNGERSEERQSKIKRDQLLVGTQ